MNAIELRRLNFNNILHIGVNDIDSYTFEEYRKNGYEHTPINGYCISCEDKMINTSNAGEDFLLTNISHGAHSSDFFLALKSSTDSTQWHQDPIMFVYESPSADYGIYKKVEYLQHHKHPSKDWYWIHEEKNPVEYPSRFSGGQYGDFVLSAIRTFKLSNVYMTNLVKCGLNNKDGKFKGLSFYKEECVRNCYEQILSRELSIIQPKIVFAVGSAVDYWLHSLLGKNVFIQQIPHPAGRQRGFRDEHYKALYFWLVVRALHKAGVIDSTEGSELAKNYLNKYDDVKK